MKAILFLLLFCWEALFAETIAPVTYLFDWNKDNVADKFIFYPYQRAHNDILPADFLKITVQLSGKGDFTFIDKDSTWVRDTSNECHAPASLVKHRDLLKSDFGDIFSVKIHNGAKPMLFLFGWTPMDEPGGLDIYALNDNGIPINILHERCDLNDIIDLDNDGYSEIILSLDNEYCENYYENYHYSTYAPRHVYTINDDLKLSFNLHLTALYNKKYYVGWVGLDSARNYIIWDNPKTKKRILTTLEEAKKRYFK